MCVCAESASLGVVKRRRKLESVSQGNLNPFPETPTSSEFSFKGNMADSRIVPRFSGSKENLWKNVEWGVIVSADLTPDFKLDLKPKLPYA